MSIPPCIGIVINMGGKVGGIPIQTLRRVGLSTVSVKTLSVLSTPANPQQSLMSSAKTRVTVLRYDNESLLGSNEEVMCININTPKPVNNLNYPVLPVHTLSLIIGSDRVVRSKW